MKTYLSPDAIKNFTIPAEKLSNTIVFKLFQTIDENNNVFLPDENYKEHNWEVIQKFNESYIYGSGSTDIYYITLLFQESDGIATHKRYTGQIHIGEQAVMGLMFNDYHTQQDIVRYKYVMCDLELWQEVTSSESTGLPNDELFESFSNNLFIRVIDFEVPTKYEINDHQIFLQYYQNLANDADMYTNKQGYESHNLKVLKRMFQNIDTGGDEVFFVTFNSGVNGSVGSDLHTGILQLKDNEIVTADLPIGLAYDVGNRIGNRHYILFSEPEILRQIADEDDSIENLFFRCYDVTLPDKKYVDSITSNNTTLVNVTYDELIETRNSSSLIPGTWYRITDYVTTTSQANTQSAGHQFDVIVLATSENTLSEEARAIQHDGDEYFNTSNLDAWKIWYSLDNDTDKFVWADATNGKGVIYRMIDEYGNDCPYDFKNIMFLRGLYADGGLIPYHEPNGDEDLTAYCYTFGWLNEDSTMLDVTIFGNNGTLLDDVGLISGAYGNIIKANFNLDSPTNVQQRLNNIVFLSTYYYDAENFYGYYNNSFGNDCSNNTFENYCIFNSFGNRCYSNSFGNDCQYNSFGNDCSNNTFENYCQYNSFGNSYYHNSFGSDCYFNSFGDGCSINSFGNECYNNSFGDECDSNSFGNGCYGNSFGNECRNNSFGNGCSNNSFGNKCYDNSFESSCTNNSFRNGCHDNSIGNNCGDNSFGDSCVFNLFGGSCRYNSFGNGCYYNSFRNSASQTGALKDYVEYNHFDDGCSYNVIWNSSTTSSSIRLKNINVNRGVYGINSNFININILNSEQEINVNQVDGIISIGDILSIRYESLKTLRDNSQLIPGQQYRIIDYITTTSQENTQSAGHQFDIIVTAVDESTLNENALATMHNGDIYFADSDLNAWQIWYCLDNDTNRFAWAGDEKVDEIEHKYYNSSECTINSELIDGNSFITPFNFESCVWVDVNNDGYANRNNHDIDELIYEWGYFTDDNDNTHLCLYKSNADIYEEEGQPDYGDKYLYRGVVNVDGEEYDYWQKWDIYGEDVTIPNPGGYVYATTTRIVSNPDAFITTIETEDIYKPGKGVIYHMIDEFGNDCPYDFKNIQFKHPIDSATYPDYYYTFSTVIDDSVVTDHSMLKGYCYDNTIKEYINSEKQRLNNNVFIHMRKTNSCYNNSFGNGCYNNSFRDECINNSFGNSCYNNSFGEHCQLNSFGNGCSNNSFGIDCGYNSFGNNCYRNTFGDACNINSFGNGCSNNSFGNYCQGNSFGNICGSNSFGDACNINSFGNGCSNNSFRNSASETGTLKGYCTDNHFDDGCSYNVIWNSGTTSSSIQLKNINVNRGVYGTYNSYNFIKIKDNIINKDCEIQVAKTSMKEIKIYCEADNADRYFDMIEL